MSGVFPQWRPAACEPAADATHLAEASEPLLSGNAPAKPLALFSSLSLSCGESPVESDTVCFAGAPVWALDWRPSPAGEDAPSGWLAVGTGSSAGAREVLGKPRGSPNALQLWRVPPAASPEAAPSSKKRRVASAASTSQPSLALLLQHQHGVAWDVKWWPGCAASPTPATGLGLLACALGDGSVCVVSVPLPDASSSHTAVALRPAWRGAAAAGGRGPLAWTLAWQATEPHSWLAAGSTDGRVFLWNLTGASELADAQPRPPLLSLSGAPSLPLRSLAWAPACWGSSTGSLLAAAGDDGCVSVWDVRSPSAPQWRSRVGAAGLLRLAWQAQPKRLLACSEAGRLVAVSARLGHAGKGVIQSLPLRLSPTASALWGLAFCEASGSVAVCSADGAVSLARAGGEALEATCCIATLRALHPSTEPASAPSLASDGGAGEAEPLVLRLGGVTKVGSTAGDVDVEKAEVGLKAHPLQAWHRCAWAPMPRGGAAGAEPPLRLLVVGGQAGLLRFLAVRGMGEAEQSDED